MIVFGSILIKMGYVVGFTTLKFVHSLSVVGHYVVKITTDFEQKNYWLLCLCLIYWECAWTKIKSTKTKNRLGR